MNDTSIKSGHTNVTLKCGESEKSLKVEPDFDDNEIIMIKQEP